MKLIPLVLYEATEDNISRLVLIDKKLPLIGGSSARIVSVISEERVQIEILNKNGGLVSNKKIIDIKYLYTLGG